jgi:ubiquinone/menaquinone biosynthesis C-methylase UbiE
MNTPGSLEERVAREREHGRTILATGESNWGWNTPAGQIRKKRRDEFLAAAVPGLADPRVLEIGCGTGTFSAALAPAFPRLTAIDVSDVLLEVARKRFPGVDFRNEDMHRTSFENSTFDLIVGCSVLHHLDWDAALREIVRILRPGGRIRFSEPNMLNPQVAAQKKWPWLKKRLGESPDESAFTPRQIRRALERSGFTAIVAEPYEFLHPSTPRPLIGGVIALERLLQKTPLRWIGGSIRIEARKP